MSVLQTLSTDGVAPHKRIEFWNAAASETLTAESATPLHPGAFFGRLRRAEVGEMRLAELTSDAATVVRSMADISRSHEPVFLLRMQLEGESTSYQDGREATLHPGDFALCDSARPYKVRFARRASVLTLRIPKQALLRSVANTDDILLVPMSSACGASAFTSKCLLEFWRSFGELATAGVALRFSNTILELIASSYAALPAASGRKTPPTTALRMRIIDYIEQHIADCELTPTTIARAFKITPRYLHMLFADREGTVARHILHRRLEKSRQSLQDPLLRCRTVSCIAYENGFKSVQHFCKAFRERYDASPGDIRRSLISLSI